VSTEEEPIRRRPGIVRRFLRRDGRDHLWAALDFLDARPSVRKFLYFGVPALALAAAGSVWEYQNWARNNSVRIARQWLEAGRLDRAGPAINEALTDEPSMPESWRLASEFAWRRGSKEASVEFARKAALVSRYDGPNSLAWAEAALLAGDLESAKEAIGYVDPSFARRSSRALRVQGEIARREGRNADAVIRFSEAAQLDARDYGGPAAIDEVPLGIACLNAGDGPDRNRGLDLLEKWSKSLNWGADCLRALLADAQAHGDPAAVTRWAEELRAHPRCTLGDLPTCLQALQKFNPERYQAMLAGLEAKERASPDEAAQMLGWLTQIGQGAEAVRWAATLERDGSRRPPVAVGVAEALRATGQWQRLYDLTEDEEWGNDLDFLKWAYAMVAARHLSLESQANSLWQSIRSDARTGAAHALLLGDTLVAWGYPSEAADLFWAAADRADLAYQAYGSLARLYQAQRDPLGEYRAFSKLNAMRPADRAIANNFAYYAALTDEGSLSQVQSVAQRNMEEEPGNPTYRATYAFVLVKAGDPQKALAVLAPLSSREGPKSPALAFAYGSALASIGRKSEARQEFGSLDPAKLSPKEIDWIQGLLR
jgi:Flp pilus assembly protein TadD